MKVSSFHTSGTAWLVDVQTAQTAVQQSTYCLLCSQHNTVESSNLLQQIHVDRDGPGVRTLLARRSLQIFVCSSYSGLRHSAIMVP
eukprot:5217413-Pleurochrysis_carterae.AAC.3